jgi:hypothetical protein
VDISHLGLNSEPGGGKSLGHLQPGVSSGGDGKEMEHFTVPRHGSGRLTQVVFFDGLASGLKVKKLGRLK